MRRTIWRRLKRRPPIGVVVSLAVHLLVLVALVGVGPPSKVYTVNRGEPLFVELPKAEEQAQRGQGAAPAPSTPPTPAPKAPPPPKAQPLAPKAQPQAPAPRVTAVEPAARPKAPDTPVPEPTKASPPVPAVQEAPAPDGVRQAAAPPKPAESQANEASSAPEVQPRPAQPASPTPQIAAVPPPRDPVIDSRSALRRGAPGVGGFGEGRAGIEGDPIPLNSADKRFADYLIRVTRMIQDKMGAYPCVKNWETGECDHKSTQVVVEFGILRDGQVPYVTVHHRAPWEVYDSNAVTAIKLASPFPPVPASLMATRPSGSAGVPIVANFFYIIEKTSIMNFLR